MRPPRLDHANQRLDEISQLTPTTISTSGHQTLMISRMLTVMNPRLDNRKYVPSRIRAIAVVWFLLAQLLTEPSQGA